MGTIEKAVASFLILLGVGAILLSLLCIAIAIDGGTEETTPEGEEEGSGAGLWAFCSIASLVIGLPLVIYGWKLLNKEDRGYYPTQPPPRPTYPARYSHPPPSYQNRSQQIIIQNIGEYIAGGKVDIRDSVVQRSQIGGMKGREIDFSNKNKALKEYRKLLITVWEDGVISDYEYGLLKSMRKHEEITMEDHIRIEKEVLEEIKKKEKYTCEKCGGELEYIDDYERWYCWNCEEYA